MAGIPADRQMRDGDVFGFARPRGYDGPPACIFGGVECGLGLGDGAGLVRLDQGGVANADFSGAVDTLRAGDKKIVADNLNSIAEPFRKGPEGF